MNIAILRVEGPELSLKELLKSLPLACDTEWSKDDRSKSDRANAAHGFSSTIADTRNPKELIDLIRIFLACCKDANVVFSSLELIAELDIGFTVGGSEQFVGSVTLSPSELLLCGECGISLSVTAYPTSDDVCQLLGSL